VKKILIVSLAFVLLATRAYAEEKSPPAVVESSDAQVSEAKPALNISEEASRSVSYFASKIDQGLYDEAIKGLKPLLGMKSYRWKQRRILTKLIEASTKKGDDKGAIKFHKKLISDGKSTFWFSKQIANLRRMMRQYKIKGGRDPETLNEKTPVDELLIKQIKFDYSKGDRQAVYEALAMAYFGRVHLDVAEKYFKEVLKIDPHTSDAYWISHTGLRDIYILQGRFEEAIKENEWLIDDKTDKESKSYQGLVGLSAFLKHAKTKKIDPRSFDFETDIIRGMFIKIIES